MHSTNRHTHNYMMKGDVCMTELEWMRQFGFNLKNAISESGFTQEELALEIGVDRTTINRYLNGKRIPTIKSIINLSYALDYDLEDLIDFGEPIE